MSTVPTVWPGSANVRSTDPITSHEAADRADVVGSRIEVCRILSESAPLTDEAIYSIHIMSPVAAERGHPWSLSRMRTARKELTRMGIVEVVGTGKNRSGYHAKVWALTQGAGS